MTRELLPETATGNSGYGGHSVLEPVGETLGLPSDPSKLVSDASKAEIDEALTDLQRHRRALIMGWPVCLFVGDEGRESL